MRCKTLTAAEKGTKGACTIEDRSRNRWRRDALEKTMKLRVQYRRGEKGRKSNIEKEESRLGGERTGKDPEPRLRGLLGTADYIIERFVC